MSTGRPADPVCTNTTAAKIASPPGTGSKTIVGRPVCRVITPTSATQTATPPGA